MTLPSSCAPTRRSDAGFTVLELIIASAVSMVVLLIAMDTLRVSFSAVAIAGEETLLRGRQWPVTLLRRDVRRAGEFLTFSAAWSGAPLILRTELGKVTYWRSEEGHLSRSFEPDDPTMPPDQAVILPRTTSWQWRNLPGGALQVRFAVQSRRARGDIHGQRQPRIEQLVLAPRAGVRAARW